MHTTLRFIRGSLTHLLWGVNGLLKLPFMKMGLTWIVMCTGSRWRGAQTSGTVGLAVSFPINRIEADAVHSMSGNACGILTPWQHCSPNIVHFSPRVGEALGNRITAEQILIQRQWTQNTDLRFFTPFRKLKVPSPRLPTSWLNR